MSDVETAADPIRADLVLAGGGLAAGLIALRLKRARPDLRILIVERAAQLGAGHTWSLFESDLSPHILEWVSPLFAHRWPGYHVRFPAHSRDLDTPYASITAERFDAAVRAAVGEDGVLCGVEAAALHPDRVELADGRTLRGGAVVDARGPARDAAAPGLKLGFQKFVGIEIETARPHGLDRPIVMDATVPQKDGYRFVYTLPFSPTCLLVEDTRYADGDALDHGDLADEARAYAHDQGWEIVRELRREHGVLPVALGGDIDAFWRETAADGVGRVGLRAALFHPTTGYSLPDAARLAERIGRHVETGGPLTTAAIAQLSQSASREAWADRAFFRLLNRMLFKAAAPDQRYRVLERFYRLPAPLMRRFYASELTRLDKLRILTGKPPVPIHRALRCLSEERVTGVAA